MLTLYWEFMAGSIVVQAMLEELGADYRLEYVDMQAGAHQAEDFSKINPACRVPALKLPDGTSIGETAAIIIYLGELLPENRLVPPPGDDERANFLFWLNVMATAGYLTVSRWAHPERYALDAKAICQVADQASQDLHKFYDLMEQAIAKKPNFLSGGFTALDLYLTMLTEWHADRDHLFSTRPGLAKIANAVGQRPAYRHAMQTHLLPVETA